ncbi:aldehyde dehydrogenase [Sphingomonas yabuuchiae]|uniref:Aldehyde dehydrogenase n=1 Tax=Sphingomonas yabuuchiae TaxID=172044 RepID=A0A147IU53_9SPHN|nr:aldehyde dehydrogenase family protein [Sphingomonas yabuuchiae]KTT99062.1 aldehyde dehydrogenase [Sphingomonas yabuuchiae]
MDFDTSFHMTIGGKPVSSDSLFDVLNPATEQVLAQAPDATRDHLDSAVIAARTAFPGWAATPIAERRALIDKLGDAVIAHAEDFKRLLTAEQGKPHADAFNEVMGAGLWLKGAATLDLPVTVNEDSADRYSETRRVPIGVVGAIAPWNFPMVLAIFKVGPALLAGNTLVLKPSPFTPLTTLKFGELAATILPPGVLNVVTGGDSLGPWLTEHPGIDKVSFTGSTATGRRVMQSASATLKRVTLELGGNDAAIVLPDADVEVLAEQLFWAAFTNNGQICIATKRMYVHRDVYEPLKEALVAYARTVQIGDGAQQGVRLGPINNHLQYERVLDLIRDARDKGYRFLLGGEAADTPGYFVPITILDNPPEDSRIVQEEQFGPILPLLRFDDVDEVIERVNASEYGLGASIWTGNPDAAMDLAARIASGTVWINETQHLTPFAAFGGMKQSGLGVEGGTEGLMEYTNSQTITRRR